jgi:hypothetical protein
MAQQSPEPNESKETLWRGKPSGTARADLASQPELLFEARLTEALSRLPDALVPSNFTARVLDALERDEAQAGRAATRRDWRLLWRSFLPRFAVTTAVALFVILGFERHEAGVQRAEIAKSLSAVAAAPAVPSVDALNNFDAIQRMSQPVHADTDLLAALQ